MKSTFGTGAFMLPNTEDQAHVSQHRLLTVVAYRIAGKVTLCSEGWRVCCWCRHAVAEGQYPLCKACE